MPNFTCEIIPNKVTIGPLPSGIEFLNEISRRRFDFADFSAGRLLYLSDSTADLGVGMDYSTDDGDTWHQLLPQGPTVIARTVVHSDWNPFPVEVATAGDVLVRCVAYGGSGSKNILFVEFQYR